MYLKKGNKKLSVLPAQVVAFKAQGWEDYKAPKQVVKKKQPVVVEASPELDSVLEDIAPEKKLVRKRTATKK